MQSKLTVNGEVIVGNSMSMSILYLVISKIIQSGTPESLGLKNNNDDGTVTHTTHLITPTSTVSMTLQNDPNDPEYVPLATNLKMLALKHFGDDSELANAIADDEVGVEQGAVS